MQRLQGLAIGLVVGIIVTLALTAPWKATAEERWYKVPGDVNGDGSFNIADPMYLLNYIFAFGPAPVGCEPCDHPPGVPRTGQEQCYGIGTEISCEDPLFPGQDGFFQAGNLRIYRDNGDGTITDETTGLMWQKEVFPPEWTWQEALAYCDIMQLAGYEDWRLPNVMELHSLVDYARYASSIDPIFELDVPLPPSPEWDFWTSTTHTRFRDRAWYVEFGSGGVGKTWKDETLMTFRAVRGPVTP